MKSGDKTTEQKKRIGELKAIKPDQFVLLDAELLTQGDIEEFADAMGGFNMNGENLNPPRMRRFAFQAAHKIGWFTQAPEVTEADFPLMPPPLVTRVGDRVLEHYNAITIPDESFT